jgi:predicted protein tyrosine phosphatase
MLTQVSFMPLKRVLSLAPSPQTIVISITDSSPRAARPDLRGYRDVLRLEFVDIAEEHVGAAVGSWPVEPTPDLHESISGLPGERLPALSDALAVRNFLDAHHATAAPTALLVHCFAGASRSAAIAQWASMTYHIPLDDVEARGTSDANERLLRLLALSMKDKGASEASS